MSRPPRFAIVVFAAWLGACGALALSGLLETAPRVLAPLLIVVPVAAFLVGLATSPSLRGAVGTMDLRWPVLLQVIRAPMGLGFLVLERRGVLPGGFAIHAGWGDLVVGVASVFAFRAIPMSTRERRRFVVAWNAVGLADILLVVATAQLLLFMRPGSGMEALWRSPLALIPVVVVPLVLVAHVVVELQLAATRRLEHRRAADRH